MTDILVRDVPEDVVAAMDANAARLGLSRSEYIRRQWAQDARRSTEPVTVEHLEAFAARHQDILDPEVMDRAWR